MTDDPGEPQDLAGLQLGDDPARTNALIAGIVARARRTPQRSNDIVQLHRMQRTLAAAAAAFVAIAAVTVFMTPRGTADISTDQLIASWADSRHVPTNGELLTLFQGYEP
jgi:hypothetical protein